MPENTRLGPLSVVMCHLRWEGSERKSRRMAPAACDSSWRAGAFSAEAPPPGSVAVLHTPEVYIGGKERSNGTGSESPGLLLDHERGPLSGVKRARRLRRKGTPPE